MKKIEFTGFLFRMGIAKAETELVEGCLLNWILESPIL